MFLTPAVAVLAAAFIGDMFAGRLPLRGWLACRLAGGYGAIAARALAVGLLLVIAYQSAVKVSGSFNQADIELDKAKRLAAQTLREDENAVLLLSTGRSQSNFILYTGFDSALQQRTLLCNTDSVIAESRDAIVFIDKRLSTWLLSTYGDPNCNEQLIYLSSQRGDEVLIDDDGIYLSLPRSAEPREFQ